MKNSLLILCLLVSTFVSAQSVLGKWKVINDEGISKCIVNIYKDNGKIYGKITEVLIEEDKNSVCHTCEGEQKNKPIVGLVIIKDLEKEGEYYKNGTIFDPENGSEYKCRLTLENENTLQVRGYLAFFYRTQYWVKIDA